MINPYFVLRFFENYVELKQRFYLTKLEALVMAREYYLEVVYKMKRDGMRKVIINPENLGTPNIYCHNAVDYRSFSSLLQYLLNEASSIYRWNENVNMSFLVDDIGKDFCTVFNVKDESEEGDAFFDFCYYSTPNQVLMMLDELIAAYITEEIYGWYDSFLELPIYDKINPKERVYAYNSDYEIYWNLKMIYNEKVA